MFATNTSNNQQVTLIRQISQPIVFKQSFVKHQQNLEKIVITFFGAGVGVSTMPLQIYAIGMISVNPRGQCRIDTAHDVDTELDRA